MTEPPRIVFPCDYPIKVIGIRSDRLVETVLDIVRTGEDQLRALHQDLVASPLVKMVL